MISFLSILTQSKRARIVNQDKSPNDDTFQLIVNNKEGAYIYTDIKKTTVLTYANFKAVLICTGARNEDYPYFYRVKYNGVEGYISERDAEILYGYKGYKVFEIAMKKIGCPYVYAASGPYSFDSMGLVYYAYKQIGVTIPRSIKEITSTYKKPRNGLKGDIVVYSQGKSIGLLESISPGTGFGFNCITVSIKTGVIQQVVRCWGPSGYQIYQVL